MKKNINYLDLFSGIGGFTKGILEAGFEFKWHGFSEIDKHASKLYKSLYPEAEELGDVTTINTERLPELDLVTFGFPCQDLSIAGKRQGLEGSRSSLFFVAIKIIRDKKPSVFIFENVKGLLSINEGRDFQTILETIADIGLYDCEWQLLNTRWFLPQNRERIFFVGRLRGQCNFRQKIFPIRETVKICDRRNKSKIHKDAQALTSRQYANWRGNFVSIDLKAKESKTRRGTVKENIVGSLDTNCDIAIPVLTPERMTKRQNGRRFKENGDPSFTLTSQDKHGVYDGCKIRRLTPLECFRLQGFPDWYIDEAIKLNISDTQLYKMAGNSVSVPVVKAVVERLRDDNNIEEEE